MEDSNQDTFVMPGAHKTDPNQNDMIMAKEEKIINIKEKENPGTIGVPI